MMKTRTQPATVRVGDRVRLLKNTRHGMIKAGTVGTVEEIRTTGLAAGISVRFPHTPHPTILRMFPDAAHDMRCLFADGRNLEVVR